MGLKIIFGAVDRRELEDGLRSGGRTIGVQRGERSRTPMTEAVMWLGAGCEGGRELLAELRWCKHIFYLSYFILSTKFYSF